jgi:type I restriction enzyme, R subunit
MRLPPFSSNLQKLLSTGKKPSNDVYLLCGMSAWRKAKYFSQHRFTMCLPPYLDPRNLAIELLERLLEGEIKTRFLTNVVQEKKFSELLVNTIKRYQNRAIETAQVMEELCEMAKKFKEAVQRGESVGLNEDELAFYDALANNEASVKELGDDTLKKIAHELTENLRKNVSVDWSVRDSVHAQAKIDG